MTRFGIVSYSGMKDIKSDQVTWWYFGNFFVPFGFKKFIVVDADGYFSGLFKKTSKETLMIPVHEVSRGNQKEIINEGVNFYLNKSQKIN